MSDGDRWERRSTELEHATESDARSDAVQLTPREREVFARVLRGSENKRIAADLGIAEQSVKEHVSSLLTKFGVPNRASLVAEAGARLELTGGLGIDRSWIPQLFLSAVPEICVLRGPDLRYEAVNESFRQAVGDRPVLGRTMREAFPELQGQGIFELVEYVYATGEPFVQHERVSAWDRGNGVEPHFIDLVLQPLRAEDGTVNGVVSFAIDVTDLVRARGRED